MKDKSFDNYTTYIMSSYVKYIEAQGARVVPIFHDESNEETIQKLKGVNGVLFPGGGGDYLAKGNFVFDYVTKLN